MELSSTTRIGRKKYLHDFGQADLILSNWKQQYMLFLYLHTNNYKKLLSKIIQDDNFNLMDLLLEYANITEYPYSINFALTEAIDELLSIGSNNHTWYDYFIHKGYNYIDDINRGQIFQINKYIAEDDFDGLMNYIQNEDDQIYRNDYIYQRALEYSILQGNDRFIEKLEHLITDYTIPLNFAIKVGRNDLIRKYINNNILIPYDLVDVSIRNNRYDVLNILIQRFGVNKVLGESLRSLYGRYLPDGTRLINVLIANLDKLAIDSTVKNRIIEFRDSYIEQYGTEDPFNPSTINNLIVNNNVEKVLEKIESNPRYYEDNASTYLDISIRSGLIDMIDIFYPKTREIFTTNEIYIAITYKDPLLFYYLVSKYAKNKDKMLTYLNYQKANTDIKMQLLQNAKDYVERVM